MLHHRTTWRLAAGGLACGPFANALGGDRQAMDTGLALQPEEALAFFTALRSPVKKQISSHPPAIVPYLSPAPHLHPHLHTRTEQAGLAPACLAYASSIVDRELAVSDATRPRPVCRWRRVSGSRAICSRSGCWRDATDNTTSLRWQHWHGLGRVFFFSGLRRDVIHHRTAEDLLQRCEGRALSPSAPAALAHAAGSSQPFKALTLMWNRLPSDEAG